MRITFLSMYILDGTFLCMLYITPSLVMSLGLTQSMTLVTYFKHKLFLNEFILHVESTKQNGAEKGEF